VEYSSVKDDKDGEELMEKYLSKSFTTTDPRVTTFAF